MAASNGKASRSQNPRRVSRWRELCREIVEMIEAPAMILEARELRVVLLNRPMEVLIGWSSGEAEGRPWAELCLSFDSSTREAIIRAAAETTIEVRDQYLIRNRQRIETLSSLVALKSTKQNLLLAKVLEVRYLPGGLPSGSYSYSISARDEDWGRVEQICFFSDDDPHRELLNRRCFEVFMTRSTPCQQCPARHPQANTQEISMVLPDCRGDGTALVTSFPQGEKRRRILHKQITDKKFSLLIQARLEAIIKRAGLSQREAEVFSLLMKGRAPVEIGVALGVELSTAKYHVSNILKKLDAESRFDLLRVLF
jgi:DNA-binding CsgD family transcriptional regulator